MSRTNVSTLLDPRESRGLQIAATQKIKREDGQWLVPSQTGDGTRYAVNLEAQRCTCPDYEIRKVKCKHLFAVEYTIKRETAPDGTLTETQTVKATRVKITYPQDWTAYNAAQTEEKAKFTVLLADLCKGVPQPPPKATGRPRLPLSEMLFAAAFKVYCGFSARRFTSDLRSAKGDGLIASEPHFNSVSNYLADAKLTPVLKQLVAVSSLPLKAVETDFAVDSSGFGTSRFVRWFNKKYGRELDNREWVKVHLMCGVTTHTVTSVDISGWEANDTSYFVPLLEQTARSFQVAQVSGDKAYLSHKNLAAVEAVGGTPFVPFKVNTLPTTECSAWGRMYHYFMLNRDGFLAHYHKRSNVETTFSMIKAKFGDAVRSKGNAAMVNEVLCKVLCHNICVVIQSIHELGIAEPTFCAQLGLAQKLA